jgi:hypothetical protein
VYELAVVAQYQKMAHHKLIHYLTTKTTTINDIDSDRVNQVLFAATCEQGLNISTVDVLLVQVTQEAALFGEQ